jgi:hypothetical protein
MSGATRKPDFIVGGAPRSGTTWLARNLCQHADIWMAQPLIPEPKTFILGGEVGDAVWSARLEKTFGRAPINLKAGEKTSNYLESSDAPRRIRAHIPNVKLLFILREPVDRAWSNYLWSRQNGLESLDFEAACSIEAVRPDPMPAEKKHARPYDYQWRSRYGTLLENWLRYFANEQICLLRYEDIARSPQSVLDYATSFIGLPSKTPVTHQNEVINPTGRQSLRLARDTMNSLRTLFVPEMKKLHALTGFDIAPWGY